MSKDSIIDRYVKSLLRQFLAVPVNSRIYYCKLERAIWLDTDCLKYYVNCNECRSKKTCRIIKEIKSYE